MDRLAQLIWRAGYDRKAAQDAAVSGIAPALPKTGKRKQTAIRRHDRIGLRLAARLPPFIEGDRRHEAAAPLEGVAERRGAGETFGPLVDAAHAKRDVLRPQWHQAPAQQVERALARFRVVAYDRQRVGRRRIV